MCFAKILLIGFVVLWSVPVEYGTSWSGFVFFLLIIAFVWVYDAYSIQKFMKKKVGCNKDDGFHFRFLFHKLVKSLFAVTFLSFLLFDFFFRISPPDVPSSLYGISLGKPLSESHLDALSERGMRYEKIVAEDGEWQSVHYKIIDPMRPSSTIFVTLNDKSEPIRVMATIALPVEGNNPKRLSSELGDELSDAIRKDFDSYDTRSQWDYLLSGNDYDRLPSEGDDGVDKAWITVFNKPSWKKEYWLGRKNMAALYREFNGTNDSGNSGHSLHVVLQNSAAIEKLAQKIIDNKRKKGEENMKEEGDLIISNKVSRLKSAPIN